VLLAAVTYRPRLGDAKPISALLPQVLARYGLDETTSPVVPGFGAATEETAGINLLA